ncbi:MULTISPECIES: hypothetical protein [Bradyrhizobium]|uniref:hypothetical protein n=1 Tax=Bradyrhizobium TaxID=374 RepID=UPI002306436D|nr:MULTISPECIES: hypothetical protein [unclassified Bradyrhizobium]MDA9452372.1 hypothetical protein [Bradyrhizobium sp. CCBAU 21360]MDA9453011.1 hypothetical protein [Bradyrhizobium sp. CCBAU 21359]MDA9512848.1 hypothetical protein [Bradyrhizobium sp. CCBAU 11430]
MRLKVLAARMSIGAAWLVLVGTGPLRAEPVFDGLAGAWSGIGTMKPSDGPREKVRCKVAYNVTRPGRSLTLDLRCASDAYKMVLSANIEQSGTELSGNWFESEYRQGGKVYGTNKDGLIEARIEGNTVAALVTIQTRSNRQSFLMEAPGSWMTEVAIELNKEGK